jgi:hemoglobin-like flavoprotein
VKEEEFMGEKDTSLQATIVSLLEKEEQFVATFYHHLFTMYPPSKALFAQTDMRLQHYKLLVTLTKITRTLNDPQSLALELYELGRHHTYYQVKPEHYTQFGNALFKTFAEYLDSRWTPALEAIWMQAYQSIVQMMCSDLPANRPTSHSHEAHALDLE